MKTSALKYTVLSWVSIFTMLILFLMPFHALLTVWGSSLIGHYTALRLWKEVLLTASAIGVLYLMLTDHKIRTHTLSRRLVWLILAYIALNIVWGLLALNQHDVTAKALGYGLIVNLRFLVFFLVYLGGRPAHVAPALALAVDSVLARYGRGGHRTSANIHSAP